MRPSINILLTATAITFLTACTIHPAGETGQRSLAREAGTPYLHPFEERQLPPLSPDATANELVTYALLSSADLEQKYWEWRSAIEQIPQDGTQKTNLMLSFNSMITNGTSAAANNTIGAGNDPMSSIVLPQKLATSAQIALADAQAAGRRFDKARLELQSRVVAVFDDYALTAETARLQQANLDLLQVIVKITESRVATSMALQQDLLKAANEHDMAEGTLKSTQAQLTGQLASLNALLNRAPDAPLTPPASLPAARPLPGDDAEILSLAAQNNPELKAQDLEIAGKEIAIRRAKQEYLPDFGINISTDLAGMTQSLLGTISMPLLRYQAIDAQINQARANLNAADAQRRQTAHDIASQIISDLAALRDAQRQADLFENIVLPRAQRVVTAVQNSYANGQATLLDLLDAQRSLIAIRQTIAELRTEQDKRLATLEASAARTLATQ